MPALPEAAAALLDALGGAGETLVLAESCTGGLAAAALVAVPGASAVLAGSFVTYQEASKAAWLGVPPALFAGPGVVSAEVAAAMAVGALRHTPHATVAAAITGHLGPHAPADLDGVVWTAAARRGETLMSERHRLAPAARGERQAAAAGLLLDAARRAVAG